MKNTERRKCGEKKSWQLRTKRIGLDSGKNLWKNWTEYFALLFFPLCVFLCLIFVLSRDIIYILFRIKDSAQHIFIIWNMFYEFLMYSHNVELFKNIISSYVLAFKL